MNMGRRVIAGFALVFLLFEIVQLGLCERCIGSEKQALLKFKASFRYDPLNPFNNLSSWNPETNCCRWDGIICHNVTGHVLKLISNGLEASGVDPSLLELQHLIYLDLSGNNFNATSIPVFLGSMERLRYLSLSKSNLIGKIPTNLGEKLTDLKFLDLSGNDLHINDMTWLSKLQSLQQLNLSDVYLGEAHNLFQVIHMLSSLSELQLQRCGLVNLSIPLPPMNSSNKARVQVLNLAENEIDGRILNAFQNWTSVEILHLNENNLRSVPLWFGEFKYLVSLDLSSNALAGPIPIVLHNLTSLEDLNLSSNKFSSIPSWFGEFKNLVYLDLSSNALAGPIPIVLRNLTSLEDLDLSLNNFSSIPSWLGELRNLHDLGISSNQIIATMEISVSQILKDMCHLKKLDLGHSNLHGEAFGDSDLFGCIKYDIEDIYLRSNTLSGHLPTWVGHLENLNFLDLSGNCFSDNIPQNLGQLSNLHNLNLSSNSFSGNIPPSFGQLSNLQNLDLSNNSLSGNIPHSLGQLVNLTTLKLSNNSLSGNIPQSLGQLVDLTNLLLSRNNLHGTIPRFLCQIKSLNNLDLSHNNFSGEIPNCWRDNPPMANTPMEWMRMEFINLNGLIEINFSFNKLSGAFPISISKLSSLFWLRLNNNHLEGKLPLTFKNELRILDLGENKFCGSIPSWTNITFPTLLILRLCNNMLDGNIPSKLCQIRSLQILDLANNNLNGSIPNCIGNLTRMAEDIVNTRQDGSIPNSIALMYYYRMKRRGWHNQNVKQVVKGIELDYTTIWQLVVNLDLSNNDLVGSIPFELFSLVGLIGLNLSRNHLEGEIPDIIGNMKHLESFDISYNQISGTIPKSMPMLTALSHLNMSYNNLSGPIPTQNQFLTLNDPSIYAANPYLCGIPLPNKCQVDDAAHQVPEAKELEDEKDPEKVWFYFVIAIGFIVGFWGAIGTLVVKKSWRHVYFRQAEDVADVIYVFTSIKMAKLKRLITNHVHG